MTERESRKAAIIIPARLGSRRFSRKVLARETGKYLVQHVWEGVIDCPGVARVIVATDSEEVLEAVRSFGGDARLTSPEHLSGTDRVAEIARGLADELIVNVQGDEPLIQHDDIMRLLDLFAAPPGPGAAAGDVVMTTLVARRTDREGFHDPNIVKAVVAQDGRALYFSRSPVAYYPSEKPDEGEPPLSWWQHIGIYAYRREFLLRYADLEPTPLEKRERLEQLRALEHGYTIRAGEAMGRHLGIDTPQEYRIFAADYLRGPGAPPSPPPSRGLEGRGRDERD